MRKSIVIIIGLALLTLPSIAMAGVQGSPHDLSSGTEKICYQCHTPHNAGSTALWGGGAPGAAYGNMADLCFTCHDGVIATQYSAFDLTKQQHKASGLNDCSGDAACHDVHNGTVGSKFLQVTATNGTFCESCHNSTDAGGLGDHTAGIEHYMDKPSTFTCYQCHSAHGATPQSSPIGSLTHPILLDDNMAGGVYGSFCVSCHKGTIPTAAIIGTGGVAVAVSDTGTYAEAGDGSVSPRHPTSAGSMTGCNSCHDIHDPTGTASGYILTTDNTDSGFCEDCHSNATLGAPSVTATGTGTHYVGQPDSAGMNGGGAVLPWANQIDEDQDAGADWSGTANEMVCETCHSVHRYGTDSNGATAGGGNYFLRVLNETGATGNQLCRTCHTLN